MRDIRFRVWNPDSKKFRGNVEDVFSCLAAQLIYNGAETRGFIYPHDCSSDGFIIEQFTGLQDKNGVDIYEGDVLEFKNDLGRRHLHKVFRAKGGLVINSHDSDIDKKNIVFYNACADMQTAGWIKQCAVIGNIHQNPELLCSN